MFKHIIDDEVELKLLDINYSEEMYKLIDSNREHLRRWLPFVDGTRGAGDTRAFIESTLKKLAEGNGFEAGIWYQGKMAGVIGFHSVNWSCKSISIGYWLGAEFTGRGIITKSCRAFLNHAFNVMNLNRVEIRCAEENFKSRAIPERLGFTREGIIREAEWLGDHYVDNVVFGMLSREWN